MGVAPQTNTELKNWFEKEEVEMQNSYRAQQRPTILLSSRRARISARASEWEVGDKASEATDTSIAPVVSHSVSLSLYKDRLIGFFLGCVTHYPAQRRVTQPLSDSVPG